MARKPKLVVSLLTQDNDYQVEQAAAAEEASRSAGADIDVLYADNDSILQSQQILKFIQGDTEGRPDCIILEPVGGTGLPQVAKAAMDAGKRVTLEHVGLFADGVAYGGGSFMSAANSNWCRGS